MCSDLPTVPLLAGQSRFFPVVPRPAKSWKYPAFCTKSFFFCARTICNAAAMPRRLCKSPIERNYGNSVRFLAKIPNGTAAELPCYSVIWNAIDFCRLYTSKKISMWALPTVPLFAGKSRFFTRNVPKNILQVGRSVCSTFYPGEIFLENASCYRVIALHTRRSVCVLRNLVLAGKPRARSQCESRNFLFYF